MAQNKMKWAPTTNAFQTTLNGAINATATTITLNSVTGLQNKAGILVIDRVNSAGTATPSSREYIYFTGVSGSSVTLPSVGDGRGQGGSTGQSHADGAVVEAIMDVDAWNGLVDSYDVQHNDSGTHNALTTDTFSATSLVSISSSLFVAGQGNFPSTVSINQSAIGQTIISTRLRAPVGVSGASLSGELAVDTTQNNLLVGTGTIGAKVGIGAWASWSPTLTNMTLGNGTVVARYTQIGKTIIFKFKFTLGSTSAVGTAPNISLPVTAQTDVQSHGYQTVGFNDSGGSTYFGHLIFTTTTAEFVVLRADLTYLQEAQTQATVPFTFGTGDSIEVTAEYEAA